MQRPHCRNRSGGGEGADWGIVGVKRQGVQRKVHRLMVEKLHAQPDFLPAHRRRRVRSEAVDAHIIVPLHPDGRGDGDIPVRLSNAEIIVAVSAGDGQFQGFRGRFHLLPGNHHAAVGNHRHLADGAVRWVIQGYPNHRIACGGNDGAHDRAVEFIENLQVAVLRGVDPAAAQGVEKGFLRQFFCQRHRPRLAGVAPTAVVVGLIVGGRYVPAPIQGAVIVSAVRDAVLSRHLQQGNHGVGGRAVVAKVLKVTIERARVVELADGIRLGSQRLIIGFQSRGTAGVGRLIPGLPARGAEGVQMPQLLVLRPGHLVAEDANEGSVRHSGSGCLTRRPFFTDGGAVHSNGAVHGVVKGIAVVGDGEEVQVFRLRGVGKGLLHAALAVGQVGVGVKLAEIQVPLPRLLLRKDAFGHLAVLPALFGCVGTEVQRPESRRRADRLLAGRKSGEGFTVGGQGNEDNRVLRFTAQGDFGFGRDFTTQGRDGDGGNRFPVGHFHRLRLRRPRLRLGRGLAV